MLSFRRLLAEQRQAYERRLDIFAEALAQNLSVQQAAVRAGVKPKRGYEYLAELRRRLGPQAR